MLYRSSWVILKDIPVLERIMMNLQSQEETQVLSSSFGIQIQMVSSYSWQTVATY